MLPSFLTLQEVLSIHNDQLSRYGGSTGIRDEGLLRSALAQPQATFGGNYLHDDFCAMAAAYLFHILQNHPFVDGNKRVGTVASIVFLKMNGLELNATEDELEQFVLGVASGQIEKSSVIDFFRKHAH